MAFIDWSLVFQIKGRPRWCTANVWYNRANATRYKTQQGRSLFTFKPEQKLSHTCDDVRKQDDRKKNYSFQSTPRLPNSEMFFNANRFVRRGRAPILRLIWTIPWMWHVKLKSTGYMWHSKAEALLASIFSVRAECTNGAPESLTQALVWHVCIFGFAFMAKGILATFAKFA